MKQTLTFDEEKLAYNTLLINGYNSYQNKDFQKALHYYQEAQEVSIDTISSPLVKSIMGVIHVQNSNYSEAIACFNAGLNQLKTSQFRKSSSLDLEYETAAVRIKLEANLAVCYLITGQYRESIQEVESCINLLKQAPDRNVKNLYECLVYIFYRFHNFSIIRTADFDSLESKRTILCNSDDDYSQACFYSTMAINKELCQSPEQSYSLHKKAFQIWKQKKETGYMLVTAHHLLELAKELNLGKKTTGEYDKIISNLMNSEQLQGLSLKTLFKGFDEKIKCAKTITSMLIEFQKDELKYRDTQQVQLKDWKIATKLKLQKVIRDTEDKIKRADNKGRKQLITALEQVKQTLLSLQNQNNILIEKNLQRSSFVIDAVNKFNNGLKSLLTRSNSIILRHQKANKRLAIQMLQEFAFHSQEPIQKPSSNVKPGSNIRPISNITTNNPPKPNNNGAVYGSSYHPTQQGNPGKPVGYYSQVPNQTQSGGQVQNPFVSSPNHVIQNNPNGLNNSRLPVVSQYMGKEYTSLNNSNISNLVQKSRKKILKFVQLCEQGQYFQKRNFSSDGGQQKWILLTKTEIRWSTDQSKINKKGQYQSYSLKDIKGIIYGKESDTFHKSCNKQLLPWRCFSLVLQKRTFDLCSESDQDVLVWIPGLSYAIKKANPENQTMIGYTTGRLLWKKMWLILTHQFIPPLKKNEKATYYFTRAEALRRFKNNGYTIPAKKK